jgi:hypothetical protein
MRDHLIHGYFAVDYALVWDVVHTKIPGLHERISVLLAGEQWVPAGLTMACRGWRRGHHFRDYVGLRASRVHP